MAPGASQGRARPARVRAVAVGNRLRLPRTEADYVAELERIVQPAVPHLASDRPNLVVLGEVLGLPAAFAGRSATLARHAHTARNALTLLALSHWGRVRRARQRWPGISRARALLLAHTGALYRPFAETLARLAAQHRIHLVATTLAPRVRRSTDPREITAWGRTSAEAAYVPEGSAVYNAALLFGPDGALLQRVDKVYLTRDEAETLDLSPGRLEDVRVVATAAGRLGIATSLDAFTPEYLRTLARQGAEIVAQPDANAQPWAAPSKTWRWQPEEWLNAVLGSIQPEYGSLRYNVCAMQTGNVFDIPFDGQSSITSRAAGKPEAPGGAFVGVDTYIHTLTGEPLEGGFLAVAPWVVADPITEDPALAPGDRRKRLRAVAKELLPRGPRANGYRESVIWADLPLG